jgi:cobalt-zinc-cadmium resistance protein CzcA
VINAVRAGNATVGAGTIRIGAQSAVVQGIGLIRGLDDIRSVVLSAETASPCCCPTWRPSRWATCRAWASPGTRRRRRGAATVLMRRGEQTLPTIRGVQAEVARVNAGGVLPPGVRIVPLYDREDLVKVTTRTVVQQHHRGRGADPGDPVAVPRRLPRARWWWRRPSPSPSCSPSC